MSEREPAATGIEIWVRSTDIDGDGIVNNSRFFQFFEQARLEHLTRLRVVVRPRPPGVADRAFTIAETTCRFLAPLRHRDVVRVEAWTSSVGRRSFGLAYRITRPADGTVCATGSSAQVWLDADGRASELPPDVRAALEASVVASEA
ncbi:MAG: thioesterase [Chloroflexota bacterium]